MGNDRAESRARPWPKCEAAICEKKSRQYCTSEVVSMAKKTVLDLICLFILCWLIDDKLSLFLK